MFGKKKILWTVTDIPVIRFTLTHFAFPMPLAAKTSIFIFFLIFTQQDSFCTDLTCISATEGLSDRGHRATSSSSVKALPSSNLFQTAHSNFQTACLNPLSCTVSAPSSGQLPISGCSNTKWSSRWKLFELLTRSSFLPGAKWSQHWFF